MSIMRNSLLPNLLDAVSKNFARGNENIKLPSINTIWDVKGNNTLTPNNSVTLTWDNKEGLIFTKKIELDENFLFKIKQSIQNNSNKTYQFFPYAQITRNDKPEVTPIYISTKTKISYLNSCKIN